MVSGAIYEPGNSVRTKTGAWRSFKPVVDQKKCIKCRQCEMFCPDIAIVVAEKVDVDYDYCKGCGICARICPVKAIVMEKESKTRCVK